MESAIGSSSRRWTEEPTTKEIAMAEDRMAVPDILRNVTADRNVDVPREEVCVLAEAIPRVRDGSYFSSLLKPGRRAEQALLAVIQEVYVLGV
jgi:transposase-like protein